MVRCILPTFLLGAIAEESLMQFEKAGELNLDRSKAHYAAMQHSAQSMAESYQKLLQDIVAAGSLTDPVTGKDYVPSEQVLDIVKQQFTGLETELKEQQEINQGILDTHEQTIRDCNTARANAFAGADGVVAKMNAMIAARNTHGDCRDAEDTAIDGMESECKKFQDLDRCDIGDQNWYAVSNDAANYRNSLDDVIAQATSCRTNVAAVTAKATECDANQDSFKNAFCAYESALEATCTELDNCYSVAKSNKDKADTSISKLEEEQKTIWRMIQKVHCYLNLLFDAAKKHDAGMPDQAKINACNAMTASDSAISINYEAAEAQNLCADHPDVKAEPATDDYQPGTDDWYGGELQQYEKHGKLKDNSVC